MHRGRIKDYPGMDLDYSETGVINFLMIKYLQKVIDKFPEDLRGTSSTPEVDHLYKVRGE